MRAAGICQLLCLLGVLTSVPTGGHADFVSTPSEAEREAFASTLLEWRVAAAAGDPEAQW